MSSTDQQWNKNHSAIKRIMSEIRELEKNPDPNFVIQPLEGNLFEWHFTIRGPKDTEFEQGVYHGRLILPENYPYKPPDIMLLTANGRFELHKKICLSITSYHQESWSPSWGIRTIMLALIAFFPSKAEGIGSMDLSKKIRQKLAKESHCWKCEHCNIENCKLLAPYEPSSNENDSKSSQNDTQEDVTNTEQTTTKTETTEEPQMENTQDANQSATIVSEIQQQQQEQEQSQTQQPQQEASATLVQRRQVTAPSTTQRRSKQRTSTAPPYTLLAQIVNSFIFIVSILISYLLFDKLSD